MQRYNSVLISAFGTIFEWYDFTIFVYMSKILSNIFFPSDDDRISLIIYFSVFMLSYLARPIGGILFGYLGDKYGRKITLMITIFIMTFSTMAIGIAPTYNDVGLIAPLMITALRMLQGLSVGGEGIGATTFVIESFEERKSFFTSIIWASSGIGIFLASLVFTCITNILSNSEIIDYGWRIPFILGFFTGLTGLILRRYVAESNNYLKLKNTKYNIKPIERLLKQQKLNLLITFGLYALCALITYVIFMNMPTYINITTGFNLGQISTINAFALALMLCLVPFFGYLGDIYSPRALLLFFSSMLLVLTFPMYKIMSFGLYGIISSQLVFAVISAGYQGAITSFVLARLDIDVRFSVGAMGYNLSYVVFGAGSLLFLSSFINAPAYSYICPLIVTAGALISFVAIISSGVKK